MLAGHLIAVPDTGLPEYPIARDVRLDGNSFVKWHGARWLSSRTFKLCTWEVQGMLRALFDLCQNESPIGTLPDDDAELAHMLRVDMRRLRELRQMEFGPLRNWVRCLSGNEVRLMHPVVLEQVQDAIDRRALAVLSKEAKAVAVRLERLRKAMLAEGLSKEVIADEILVGRLDEYLEREHKGNRTKAAYRSALLEAMKNRWMGRVDMKT